MDGQNLGNPTISELIEKLEDIKEYVGDIKVAGAYDGNWSEPVKLVFYEGTLLIGCIS